jgi:hypothetical protein
MPTTAFAKYCQKWKLTELALFPIWNVQIWTCPIWKFRTFQKWNSTGLKKIKNIERKASITRGYTQPLTDWWDPGSTRQGNRVAHTGCSIERPAAKQSGGGLAGVASDGPTGLRTGASGSQEDPAPACASSCTGP